MKMWIDDIEHVLNKFIFSQSLPNHEQEWKSENKSFTIYNHLNLNHRVRKKHKYGLYSGLLRDKTDRDFELITRLFA